MTKVYEWHFSPKKAWRLFLRNVLYVRRHQRFVSLVKKRYFERFLLRNMRSLLSFQNILENTFYINTTFYFIRLYISFMIWCFHKVKSPRTNKIVWMNLTSPPLLFLFLLLWEIYCAEYFNKIKSSCCNKCTLFSNRFQPNFLS